MEKGPEAGEGGTREGEEVKKVMSCTDQMAGA